MISLKTRCRFWFARHHRLMSGLYFASLVLLISVASGIAGASVIRILYVEQITELRMQHNSEIQRMQEISHERLQEKDRIINDKDQRLTALAGRLGVIANKTERAAETAASAASKITEKSSSRSAPSFDREFIEP